MLLIVSRTVGTAERAIRRLSFDSGRIGEKVKRKGGGCARCNRLQTAMLGLSHLAWRQSTSTESCMTRHKGRESILGRLGFALDWTLGSGGLVL